jgi:hypothetical protein
MKYLTIFSIIFLTGLLSCHHPATNDRVLQNRIDSLEKELANTYKPGFGEFMSEIQVHHSKLWFAGQNQNWKLADFEMKEMEETVSAIRKYCTDRPETKDMTMIVQSMDSLSKAIQRGSPAQFKSSYLLLTKGCNNCHQATNHGFNVIIIPDSPPFSNQDFKPTNL